MEHTTRDTDYTDFGFKTVKTKLKTGLVHELFSGVSKNYDLMNDVMSMGLHRCWKRSFVNALDLRPNMNVLDVAGGTGDIALRIACEKAYLSPKVTVCDLTHSMLQQGREKALNAGQLAINWHSGNAEQLPYADASFDRVTIAFGLRNVANKSQALSEMARVLKPGGKWFCLEFSPPQENLKGPLKPLYDLYSFHLIPWIGEYLAKDRDAYQYLVESIRQFPTPHSLQSTILQHGFDTCTFEKWSGGIVSFHKATKI
jgi:demethylmenaquinone methyltransferase / 2-methoxy-6-polyprenyl-1,4-benzoquinol methylase